jgi:hypothetical protein
VLIDYVYNRANIDASAIVWARDMGDTANCELVGYYPDRQSWVWEADSSPMTLLPYDPAHAGAARPVTSR